MRNYKLILAALYLLVPPAFAGERPANSEVAVEDSFDRKELGKGWNSTTGEWKIVDGVLRGREIASEKHSAATRRIVETKNAVYENEKAVARKSRAKKEMLPNALDLSRPICNARKVTAALKSFLRSTATIFSAHSPGFFL